MQVTDPHPLLLVSTGVSPEVTSARSRVLTPWEETPVPPAEQAQAQSS